MTFSTAKLTGDRQGIDVGCQYRSVIYAQTQGQLVQALKTKILFQEELAKIESRKDDVITTKIKLEKTFYYAEDYHQQYLSKNPDGFCGLKNQGIRCPSPNEGFKNFLKEEL
jgi:peptide-methionine (S)-S-oxide reductase